MLEASKASRRVVASLTALTLAACAAPVGGDSPESASEAIVNGKPVNLGANSFVRFPVSATSGTLITNQWVLVGLQAPQVGDEALLDSQARYVVKVVKSPQQDDVNLVELSAPMSVGGSTSGFRRALRTTLTPAGTHARCYGYGTTKNGGISGQLTYEELYLKAPQYLIYEIDEYPTNPYGGPGDSGGGCLDDTGALLGVLDPLLYNARPGTGAVMIAAPAYVCWAEETVGNNTNPWCCNTNADCSQTSGFCDTLTHNCLIP
jgi:hypothetical protein